jgi:glycine cleavage system aminomethyltransferase T
MTSGEPAPDMEGYRAARFGRLYHDPVVATEAAREVYRYYYRLRYPLDSSQAGRGRRLSPLYLRLAELGAVFAAKNGWERAEHFEPGRPWRRAGEDQRRFGWATPPYLGELAQEHRAVRERVGIFDLSSFGKIAVEGPGALALLERVADNRIDRPVGSVVYTQLLSARGGILADVTVTRLAEDRFRVVTGAGAVDSDLHWLECNRAAADGPVTLRDDSEAFAVVGVWGPRAREVLAAVSGDDVSGEAIPFRQAREIEIGGVAVLAVRITFVGELGYELYVPPSWALQVWDRLVAAGAEHGIRAGGYRVLESLRIEKGYRYFGTDLTPADTPYEGGVGFCVAREKADFNGAAALESAREAGPRWRLRTLVVGDGPGYLRLYGGEAVRAGGAVVGRVRSCAYAFTLERNVALATVPPELEVGAALAVEVLGEPVAAVVVPEVLHDPDNASMLA